jgi:hypothetical protein
MSLFKNKSYLFKDSELGFQVQMNQLDNLLRKTQIMNEIMQFVCKSLFMWRCPAISLNRQFRDFYTLEQVSQLIDTLGTKCFHKKCLRKMLGLNDN